MKNVGTHLFLPGKNDHWLAYCLLLYYDEKQCEILFVEVICP
jgi:hypothetical protein